MAHFDLTQKFEFSAKGKRNALIMIALGAIAVAFGFFTGHAERTFANLLLNSYYITGICLADLFFVAVQYVANAGWSASLISIPSAFSAVLPYAGLILVIVVVRGLFSHNLYHHWSEPALTDPASPSYDKLIAGKSGYLNIPL